MNSNLGRPKGTTLRDAYGKHYIQRSIKIEEELYDNIRDLARIQGTSMVEIIRRALSQYVDEHYPKED